MSENRNPELPSVEFIEVDAEKVINELQADFETMAGRALYPADPYYSLIRWAANALLNIRAAFNEAAKMNLPRYATGEYLDSVAELFHDVARLPGAAASCMMEITLSEPAAEPLTIPEGTEFSVENLIFATDDNLIIEAGQQSGTVVASCTTAGAEGNGYAPGQITTIVRPFLNFDSCRNTTATEGGTDPENDNALYTRMVQSEESYSVAGAIGAYEYHTKTVSADIIDVKVTSPTPGYVKVYPLCTGGQLPSTALLEQITKRLLEGNVRPLTDNVEVLRPDTVDYDINLSYYISSADIMREETIKTAINNAVESFILWQRSKLGRDVEPAQLYYMLRAAGAERITVTAPVFTPVNAASIATVGSINIEYKGLKDE